MTPAPQDIALRSQARELARRHYEARRRISDERGLFDATVPYDELRVPHRAVMEAAFEEMLKTWVVWSPSGRGVGIQAEEARERREILSREVERFREEQGVDPDLKWVGGTDGENDECQERRLG